MKNGFKIMTALVITLSAAGHAPAQRTRTVEGDARTAPAKQTPARSTSSPAPPTVKAKYMGGVFGYNKKYDGTLNFDDANSRLVFRDKAGKELFSIPYSAVVSAYSDTQSRRGIGGATGTVIGAVGGIYSLPTMLIKRKSRYLTLQYRDADTEAQGVTSFKIDSQQTLDAVLGGVAEKAELTRRGEIFVRPRGGNPGGTQTPGGGTMPPPE